MIELENTQRDSFVLLQLAEHRFALPAEAVAELAPPVRLHTFPHASSLLAGVIVRRGRILPVYDAARALSGKSSLAHRFYLVARRQFGEVSEMSAIPVDGECELVTSEIRPRGESAAAYISGEIAVGDESVGVLDIEAFVRAHENHAASSRPETRA
ncbi:MAG: chemotaxis protein CheW [Candidatus Acidiferrales bacterium]